MVASMGAGWGCGGFRPRPFPRQGGGLGPGEYLATWWAIGWAWWGEALAPFRGDFAGVLGAPVGLVLKSDALDRLGDVKLKGVALRRVRGAAALVELPLALPGYPDLHRTVRARVVEAVLNRALAPSPVALVVVAKGLLDYRAFFGIVGTLWAVAVPMAGGRLMRMRDPVWNGAPAGRTPDGRGGSGQLRGVARLPPCHLFWSVGG